MANEQGTKRQSACVCRDYCTEEPPCADRLNSDVELFAKRLRDLPREAWDEAWDNNDEMVAWRAIASALLGGGR